MEVLVCLLQFCEGELVPDCHAMNTDLYAQQLQWVYDTLKACYLALVNQRHTLLQVDNAPAHTTNLTKHKLMEQEVQPQPAYSLHQQITNMAHFLCGLKFNNVDKVENGYREIFLPLSQLNGISMELSFWHSDGNRQLNRMGYILMKKLFLFVICLNY